MSLQERIEAARAVAERRLARECAKSDDWGHNKEPLMATEPENIVAEKVAARLFEDEALKHCAFDTHAAVAIASIVHMVLTANRGRKGAVKVGGQTVGEARDAIEAVLTEFVLEPRVGLSVLNHGSHLVHVLGRVVRHGACRSGACHRHKSLGPSLYRHHRDALAVFQ